MNTNETAGLFDVIASMRDGSVEVATIYATDEKEAMRIAMEELPEFENWHTMSAVDTYDAEMYRREMDCARQNAESAKCIFK